MLWPARRASHPPRNLGPQVPINYPRRLRVRECEDPEPGPLCRPAPYPPRVCISRWGSPTAGSATGSDTLRAEAASDAGSSSAPRSSRAPHPPPGSAAASSSVRGSSAHAAPRRSDPGLGVEAERTTSHPPSGALRSHAPAEGLGRRGDDRRRPFRRTGGSGRRGRRGSPRRLRRPRLDQRLGRARRRLPISRQHLASAGTTLGHRSSCVAPPTSMYSMKRTSMPRARGRTRSRGTSSSSLKPRIDDHVELRSGRSPAAAAASMPGEGTRSSSSRRVSRSEAFTGPAYRG